jgi:hypothetical protein
MKKLYFSSAIVFCVIALCFFVYKRNFENKPQDRLNQEIIIINQAINGIEELSFLPYGEEYIKLRDKIIDSEGSYVLANKLRKFCLNSNFWHIRMQAYILLGWLENKSIYAKYEASVADGFKNGFEYAEIKTGRYEGLIYGGEASLRAIGDDLAYMSITTHGKKMLPLVWEAIWKKKHAGADARKFVYYTILNYTPKDHFFITAAFGMLKIDDDEMGDFVYNAASFDNSRDVDLKYISSCNPLFKKLPRWKTASQNSVVKAIVNEALRENALNPGLHFARYDGGTSVYYSRMRSIATGHYGCKFIDFDSFEKKPAEGVFGSP